MVLENGLGLSPACMEPVLSWLDPTTSYLDYGNLLLSGLPAVLMCLFSELPTYIYFFFCKLPEVFCGFPLLEDKTKIFDLCWKGKGGSPDYRL